MSASRLSLVMGRPRPLQDNEAISLPVPETGTIHVHLHLGEGDAVETSASPPRRIGWVGLIAGLAVVAAFVGGYQTGHRPAQDDISNLRLGPLPSAFVPAPGGFPAIERQLATQPVIIAPPRPAPAQTNDHPLDPTGGSASAASDPPIPSAPAPAPTPAPANAPPPARNAFGLEN